MAHFEFCTEVVIPLTTQSSEWEHSIASVLDPLLISELLKIVLSYSAPELSVEAKVKSRSPYLYKRKLVIYAEFFLDYPERTRPYLLLVTTNGSEITDKKYRFYDTDYSSLDAREAAIGLFYAKKEQQAQICWEKLASVLENEELQERLHSEDFNRTKQVKKIAVGQWYEKYGKYRLRTIYRRARPALLV